ncbi:MAG TPA: response regulator transcription factor [Methylomirabilota bacterium]|nr:response regulator transcription factor [Methylomirabilota bacterium]
MSGPDASYKDGRHKVVLVEDHILFREGLRALLSRDPVVEVVGEAANGRDAVRVVGMLSPQLVLMDIMMPGTTGIDAIAEIKRRYPKVRILVLSLHNVEEYVHESFRAGADGYLLKDATHDELRVAIRAVLGGKTYLSPDISTKVVSGYFRAELTSVFDMVSSRERQVLKLLAEGQSNRGIANYLCISAKTVEKHRSNLMKKLDLHSVPKLTAFAIDKGLAAPDVVFDVKQRRPIGGS